MIAKRDYYESIIESNDVVLATLRVDEKLISVMRGAIILDIRETANYLSADMDPDEYMDAVNYMQDLVRSLKVLDEALNDIIEYHRTHQEVNADE